MRAARVIVAAVGGVLAGAAGAEDPYEVTWSLQIATPETEQAYAVAVDGAGDLLVTGYTWGALAPPSAGSTDIFLAKYDASGGLVWMRQFGSSSGDSSNAVALDAAGSAFITGTTHGSLAAPPAGDSDVFVMKYSPTGARLWTRQFGSPVRDYSGGVAVDGAGNAYIVGSTNGSLGAPAAGDSDVILAKYSNSGAPLWIRQIGTSELDSARQLAVDSAGNVVFTGRTLGSFAGASAGGYDIILGRYDAAGGLLWTRQFGTAAWDFGEGVALDSAGNIYITGSTEGNLAGPSAGSADIVLAKYSPSGARLWVRQFGTTQRDEGYGVAVDDAGDILITGTSEGSLGGPAAGDRDAFLVKFDASGNRLWTWQMGTAALDWGFGVAAANGRAYLTGWTEGALAGPALGRLDAFLMQLGPVCVADCDSTGELSLFDFLCFQTLFGTGDPDADCNGDTVLDFFDFLCFQSAFAAGCP
ncbi:MAG: SBBP repeat-containing protein [Phycisphaerales bacterium JB039]